jgi:hypothetical protein
VRAFWSRQLTCMEVLGCGSVRLRVFLQGLGITSSLNTSLIIAFICVMEVGDWTAAQLTLFCRVAWRSKKPVYRLHYWELVPSPKLEQPTYYYVPLGLFSYHEVAFWFGPVETGGTDAHVGAWISARVASRKSAP